MRVPHLELGRLSRAASEIDAVLSQVQLHLRQWLRQWLRSSLCCTATRRATDEDKQKLIDNHDCFIFDCDGMCALPTCWPGAAWQGISKYGLLQVSSGEATR